MHIRHVLMAYEPIQWPPHTVQIKSPYWIFYWEKVHFAPLRSAHHPARKATTRNFNFFFLNYTHIIFLPPNTDTVISFACVCVYKHRGQCRTRVNYPSMCLFLSVTQLDSNFHQFMSISQYFCHFNCIYRNSRNSQQTLITRRPCLLRQARLCMSHRKIIRLSVTNTLSHSHWTHTSSLYDAWFFFLTKKNFNHF